ncbi:2798_t:CDS:2 [Ambispora leptoticha]|uniref:Phospholipid scramblase n=1 Tax=Ambispora leptoticha TaxID=144679 RepID=A0A9N9CQY5_9GLOM|nr:2798_t:CDS:2 [Ambispora leptoticha]
MCTSNYLPRLCHRLGKPSLIKNSNPFILSNHFSSTTTTSNRLKNGIERCRYVAYLRRSDNPALRISRMPPAQTKYKPPSAANNSKDTSITIPEHPDSVLSYEKMPTGLSSILNNSALVVVRQLEMLNIFLGFEQANKYALLDPGGNSVGFIAEEEQSFTSTLFRQLFRTHRPFRAVIMDTQGNVVLKIRRPFAWINSRIFISTGEEEPIGEVQQQWHLWRRRYNLFVGRTQFARIDAPILSWNFNLEDEHGGILGNVNRNFTGFGREIFTDTGQYVIRMDAAEGHVRGMTLDERAVTIAAAISIDFDYFSIHSEHGHFLPFYIPFGGNDELVEDTDNIIAIGNYNDLVPRQETPSDTFITPNESPLFRKREQEVTKLGLIGPSGLTIDGLWKKLKYPDFNVRLSPAPNDLMFSLYNNILFNNKEASINHY